jgi:hypothetical protein
MKTKFESLKLLKSEIHEALVRVGELDRKLMTLNPERSSDDVSEEDLIIIGYFLSGIYSTIEEIFVKIAKEFESKIEDSIRWHTELLNRMALDIDEVRPAVISKKSRNCLDDLRKFRHVFRFSYAYELQADKMAIVVKRWLSCRKTIQEDIQKFVSVLDQLAS